MIGLVLVSHGAIADDMLTALTHITGTQPQIATLAVPNDADIDACQRRLSQLIDLVDRGDGVCLLVDMFGATPSNLVCRAIADRDHTALIVGFSLPLLIKIAALRDEPEKELVAIVEEARDAGRARMLLASELPAIKIDHG